jgi:hypothetical protein
LAINVLFAGIPVADLEVAIEWYEIADPEGNRIGFGQAG